MRSGVVRHCYRAGMDLRVIGAGLPRTGTTSLKAAIERLTGEPCYHMTEFFPRAEAHGRLIWEALSGEADRLDEVLDGFGSAVDWPISVFWRELSERCPSALVVLSVRESADAWWTSVDRTVWEAMRRPTGIPGWDRLVERMRAGAGFGDDWDDPAAATARYRAVVDEVRATIPAERLLVWQPTDGWGPLCAALDCEVPDEPFPRLNDTAEFRALSGWTE